jgi:hypothetical protein
MTIWESQNLFDFVDSLTRLVKAITFCVCYLVIPAMVPVLILLWRFVCGWG